MKMRDLGFVGDPGNRALIFGKKNRKLPRMAIIMDEIATHQVTRIKTKESFFFFISLLERWLRFG